MNIFAMENMKEAIKHCIANQFGLQDSDIKDEQTFDELDADSLDMVELKMAVEDAFEVEIPDAAIGFDTSPTVAEYIAKMETFLSKAKP